MYTQKRTEMIELVKKIVDDNRPKLDTASSSEKELSQLLKFLIQMIMQMYKGDMNLDTSAIGADFFSKNIRNFLD